MPQHARAGSSAHSFTLTNCRVNPGAGLPALPLQGTPGSLGLAGEAGEARHPPLYSLEFIRHLPSPRSGSSDLSLGTQALLPAARL